jgi:hypothetical protein
MLHVCRYFEQKPSCVDQLRSLVGEEVKASMAQPAVATAVVQQCVSYLERLRNSPVGKGIPLLPSKMRLTSVHAPWLEVVTAPPPLIKPAPQCYCVLVWIDCDPRARCMLRLAA